MTEKNIPKISIIIPMYNSEKYIAECLESILVQTFQDFEIILVDDCSKDNSIATAEKYISKFGGRLQIIKSEKNSGGGGNIPRNIGIDLSRGEYIMFIDSDDIITNTALEELYPVAKKFNAELVQCERFYQTVDENIPADKNELEKISEGWTEFVEEPVLISENFAEKIEDVGFRRSFLVPWNRLFRRELIIKHNIKFPNFKTGGDFFFNFYALCLAKNIVRAPNIFYIWRHVDNSVSRNKLSAEKLLNKCTDTTFYGIPVLNKFMESLEFFQKNPEYKYLIFEVIVYHHLRWHIFPLYEDIPDTKLGGFTPAAKIEKLIRKKIEKAEDKDFLINLFFNRMNFFQVQRIKFKEQTIEQQAQIEQLQEEIKQLKAEKI